MFVCVYACVCMCSLKTDYLLLLGVQVLSVPSTESVTTHFVSGGYDNNRFPFFFRTVSVILLHTLCVCTHTNFNNLLTPSSLQPSHVCLPTAVPVHPRKNTALGLYETKQMNGARINSPQTDLIQLLIIACR